MKRLLLLLLIFSISFIGTSYADYNKAKAAYDRGDIKTAQIECGEYEERIKPDCKGLLIMMYYDNNIEPKKKTIQIPPNAHATGSGWACNSGYTKSGNQCTKNATKHQESYVSNLPECKSLTKTTIANWHNCFGINTLNGNKYVGEFMYGFKGGHGTMTYSNGGKYVGEYEFGLFNGQGVFTYANGAQYIGEYKQGQKHGQGAYTSADGTIKSGIWENGKFLYASNEKPNKQIIPPNAHASGSGWACNGGYTKKGNKCVINIPPNAYASGSGWLCNSGYKKDSNKCVIDQQEVFSASSGSGFAVTADGYVVTNHHVIEGCTDVKIHDKGKAIKATVVTYDPNNDIALLKGNFKPRKFYPLSRKAPGLLTEIFVAGHPFGKDISNSVKVTKGIVSSLSGIGNNFSNFQIDAALQPGNSGGPIMDDKGNVVGVAVAKLDLDKIVETYGVVPELVNFGVKSNVVINIMESENINLPTPNKDLISQSELGAMITDGTYYLSCWMTMVQIEKMLEKKVMFSNFK